MTLVTSFLLGTVSACLRTNKTLALTGIGCTLAAALLGGSRVAGFGDADGAWMGVDFFVLNLVLYSAVFVPLSGSSRCAPSRRSSGGNGRSTSPTSSSTRCSSRSLPS